MKLAFTTLGCPEWDMKTIISRAVKNGYSGVDFRGYLGEMEIYRLPEFTVNLEETKRQFQEAGLEIPCFSSSVRLFTNSTEERDNYVNELEEYGRLCKEFGTRYVRVFGGEIGEKSRKEALQIVKENLQLFLPIAAKHHLILLLETHDSWTKMEHVLQVLASTDSEHLHVLWDLHHPYRMEGELPEDTWDAYHERIKYTHVKDSYLKEGTPRGYQLCLTGQGDVPLKEMCRLLHEKGYDGYYTLEWEKVWWPDIEEPEIAFAQYATFMKQLGEFIKKEGKESV